LINTSGKIDTQRTATAQAVLKASREAVSAVAENRVPKGNAIELARAAGTLAGKRTPELIPLCHPLPLDQVAVEFEVGTDEIRILATARATARTGVEMEALMAASVAALTLYDMLKPIDPAMEITAVRLLEKRGGKTDFALEAKGRSAAVLVVSDRVSRGEAQDTSGAGLVEQLRARGLKCEGATVVPDEQPQIAAAVRAFATAGAQLIFTTGGTGLGPRDVTVEAVRPLLDVEAPGIAEAIRAYGTRRNPMAMLTRGIAGFTGASLVVTLPGSPKGAVESLEAVFPALIHALDIRAGGGH
jgi:cyclic pyranopterin phosphate synthase